MFPINVETLMKHIVLLGFLVAAFTFFNCGACVEVQNKPGSLQNYKGSFLEEQDMSERDLARYITRRTVRVIIVCSIYDTKTNEIYKPEYKNYEAGWGTGAIIYSSKGYSIIQTAAHVVLGNDATEGHLVRKCTGFKIERRDMKNVVTETVSGKMKLIAIDKNIDVAAMRVPYDFGVKSSFARSFYLGQSIRLVGYPAIRFLKGKHLSYEKGWVATTNQKGKTRWGVAGYFGNSGGSVWNQRGEIVGTAVSIGGFITLLGDYIPQQNHTYGPSVVHLKKFYRKHKLTRYYR